MLNKSVIRKITTSRPLRALAPAADVACLSSVQAEPLGFNALINRSAITLRITSDTALELVLPPTPLYDIASPETVLFTVPPEAVISRGEIVAAPALILRPSPGTPSVVDERTNEPLLELRELALQSNVTTLKLRAIMVQTMRPPCNVSSFARHASIQLIACPTLNPTLRLLDA